jgi:hypothetical protein
MVMRSRSRCAPPFDMTRVPEQCTQRPGSRLRGEGGRLIQEVPGVGMGPILRTVKTIKLHHVPPSKSIKH